MAYNSVRLDSDLPIYYKNFFPFKPFIKWLSYGKKPIEYFGRREFAFILADDVHIRYKSFTDVLAFEKDLCNVSPHKLDLGAVYNYPPKEHKMHPDMHAVERELVFDIDLTDYDNVRKCCSDAKVCQKCWKFVVAAIRILDRVLEHDFAFKARLWVFSGRRGVHCWVGDEKARKFNNTERSAIAEYLSIFVKDKVEVTKGKKKFTWSPPIISSAYDSVMEGGLFESMVYEQGWLEDQYLDSVLDYQHISDLLKEELTAELKSLPTPQLRWKTLLRYFDPAERARLGRIGVPPPPQGRDRHVLRHFILSRCYPRLDVNVSIGTNHLLKSPFCIHPKTGNVAVPLNPAIADQFDVNECPRIDKLVKELDAALKENEENSKKTLAYKHSSLAPYVENFEKFVEAALSS